jgi:hypothetical protein
VGKALPLLCLVAVSVCNCCFFAGCPGEGDPHRRVECSAGEQPCDGVR